MVGIVLGMLAVAIISQVFAVSEAKKRTTTSGSDAQINGALALYTMQREVQMAGYGVAAKGDAMGCTVNYQNSSGPGSFILAPVLIAAGNNGSNVVTVLRSAKASFSVPILITEDHDKASDYYKVQSSLGVDTGDLLIAVHESWDALKPCSMVQANPSAAKALTSTVIPVASGGAGPWNDTAILPAGGYPSDSYLLNVGSLSLRQYTLNSATNSLQMSELTAASLDWTAAQDVYPHIVVFRAMYGKDTTADEVVDTYDNTTPTTAAEWRQVRAIRLVMVARSANYEKDAVISGALQWDVGSAAAVAGTTDCHTDSKCLSIPLNFLPDWQHYRYKVYDTVVPLRNVIWNS